MTNKQRTDLIEKYIREHKYADLSSLAARFSGSLSTVRRALDSLEQRGIVRRHHGGAGMTAILQLQGLTPGTSILEITARTAIGTPAETSTQATITITN